LDVFVFDSSKSMEPDPTGTAAAPTAQCPASSAPPTSLSKTFGIIARRAFGALAVAVMVCAAMWVASPVVASTPGSAVTADDVVIITNGDLVVYRATGSGTLSTNPEVIGGGFTSVKSFYVVDWNNDGVQDLLVQWSDGRLTFYQGNAAGGFELPVQIGTGWQGWSITVGSWKNSDSYPGIVARNLAGDLYYYQNLTGGVLTSGTLIGTVWSGLGITQIDFDGDGNQDILARATDGTLRLYRSTGSGGFINETRAIVGTGWNAINSVSTVFGFDGPDSSGIMARTTAGEFRYYPVQAGGIWGQPTTLGQNWSDRLIGGAPLATDFSAELNPADVLAVDPQYRLLRYRATGSGRIGAGVQIGTGWSGVQSAFVRDWNLDGVQDIVAQWSDGRLTLYPGLNGGGFGAPAQIGTSWQGWSITVGSWKNSDRYPGIVARNLAGDLYYYQNLTGGVLTSGTLIGTGWSGLGITQMDFDGDGNQDILAHATDGHLHLYRSTGSGGFINETRAVVGTGWNAMTSIVPSTGFAGANTLGVIARASTGDLRYYPVNPDGTWGQTTVIGTGWNGLIIFGSSAP
jgi:hypothetical protein